MTSVRRILWNAGAPARLVLLGAIALYRLTLSGWLGGQCRFSPTCSHYAEEAIRSSRRPREGRPWRPDVCLRCNPFGRGGLDPVPPPWPLAYDIAIHKRPHTLTRQRERVGAMLAEIGPFQALLDAIGWLLAWLYDLTGNFGFAIIILTIVFRIVLLPLGIKQIKSMQAMQALQPKIKEIQKKYKGNKQKVQEQTMKLYQEYGVNPLGGCLPLLLQFPILIAMYSVIRAPVPCRRATRERRAWSSTRTTTFPWTPSCSSTSLTATGEGQHFLLMNLQCSPQQAGQDGRRCSNTRGGSASGDTLDCGRLEPPTVIPVLRDACSS